MEGKLPFSCVYCKERFVPMADRIINHLENHLTNNALTGFEEEKIKIELATTREVKKDYLGRVLSNDRNASLLGIG